LRDADWSNVINSNDIDNVCEKDIKERDFLKKKAVRSRYNDDWESFKSKRNSVNRLKNDLNPLTAKDFF